MDSAPALGLPEVMLGLVPGWGGAYLVPNLVGAEKAVTADPREPAQQRQDARRQGGVRARPRRRVLLRCGLPRAVAALGGRRAHRRRSPSSGPRSTAARRGTRPCAQGAQVAEAKTGGASPAAKKAVELIAGAQDGDARRGLRRRGRRPRGDVAHAGAARVALRLRPGAEAGQAARRRAGQVAGPAGDQGRHRRRGPDGQPARAAVRTPPRGAGGPHRPRPGAGRQGRGLRPRRDRQAARQGPDRPGQGQPLQGAGAPVRSTRARSSRTPTS